MLCGALLTVRLMVVRLLPKLPTLRTSSFCCFKAVWPAKAECWIAEVAIDEASFVATTVSPLCVCVLCYGMVSEESLWNWWRRWRRLYMEFCEDCGLGYVHLSTIWLVVGLDFGFPFWFFGWEKERGAEVHIVPCGYEKSCWTLCATQICGISWDCGPVWCHEIKLIHSTVTYSYGQCPRHTPLFLL